MSASRLKKKVRQMAGRPLKYKTVDELQKAIDGYFKSCEGKVLKDDDGDPVYDKYGEVIMVGVKPPTVTGLALSLGFTTRQALLNYQGKKQFVDTVTRAKSYIEEYAEQRLFDRDGVQGAKFSLANNFKGWSEKPVKEDADTGQIEALIKGLKQDE
jgi:hypothetical protein